MISNLSRLAALTALLALGVGLAAGPQPCRALSTAKAVRTSEMPGMSGASGHSDCHHLPPGSRDEALRAISGGMDGGCCGHGGSPAEHLRCERSCALPAVLTARPIAVSLGLVASLAPPPALDATPLFGTALDHIPL